MPYIDKIYYTDTYKGEAISDSDFPVFLLRASEVVDSITMQRVAINGLDSYIPFIQGQFKKAICAQIEYINTNGIEIINSTGQEQSASLGKFSYSGNSGGNQSISPLAINYLEITGLLYRGLGL